MYKNIIAAIDGSEHSYRALEHAKSLVESFGSILWLVHIFPHTSDMLGYEDFEKLFSKRKSAGQAVIDEARKRMGDITFGVREELQEGPEAEAIVRIAEEREADLIVIGTRGFGTIKGLVLGSVSLKVIHHASCAVMLVH